MKITEKLDLAIKSNEKGSIDGAYSVTRNGQTIQKQTYMTNEEWEELCSLVGMSVEEYKANLSEMSDDNKAATLATDLMGMVDYSTLFGWTSCEPEYYSQNQIKTRLNKAIAA